MSVNSVTFAARSFRPRQGASDEHIPCGSVRSEQRSRGRKEPPPGGLRRIWPVASLLVGHSPTAGGCSLLAPRHRPNWAQRTSSDLCLRPLSRPVPHPAFYLLQSLQQSAPVLFARFPPAAQAQHPARLLRRIT